MHLNIRVLGCHTQRKERSGPSFVLGRTVVLRPVHRPYMHSLPIVLIVKTNRLSGCLNPSASGPGGVEFSTLRSVIKSLLGILLNGPNHQPSLRFPSLTDCLGGT